MAGMVRVAGGAPADPLRLTRDPVEPLAAAVSLTLDPAADTYTGTTRIHLIVHSATNQVRLHARDLELGKITLAPRAGGEAVALATDRGELGLLELTAPVPLVPGAYDLEIAFSGRYRHDGTGIYKTEADGDPYVFTQMESRFARTAFPCWDEPEFKIPWQITVEIPAGLSAYSNSAAVCTHGDGAHHQIIEFARTPPMPVYLVAVAVGPFESVPVPGLPVPGRIITARGKAGLAGAIAAESPRILTALEDYFGIPYPYGKLDQVAVPEFTWGGMENAGLITYRDEAVLRVPGEADLARRRGLVQIVAHEMAHHWFGDLVTMEWWNDIWLNESFASWMEGKVVNAAYPELAYGVNAIGGKQRAMRTDALPSTGPVRREISAADDPEQLVDELSYEKGEAVLTMVEAWVGPDMFRTAMKRYFQKHLWRSTRAADLWEALREASGDDIAALVSGFIEQPGVPLVSIEVLPGDRARLTQRRYAALGGVMPASSAALLWRVPLVFKYSSAGIERTARVLLTEREQIVSVPGVSGAAWILPNSGETGYYHWRMEPARQADLLRSGLASLAPVERLGLLLNISAQHQAGELPPGECLEFFRTMARDENPDVARRAIEAMERLGRLYLDDGDADAFASCLRATLGPVLDRIGLRAGAGEPPETAGLRRSLISLLGRRGEDPKVIAFSRELTSQLVRDPRSVEGSLAATVLQVAAWWGDAVLFDACQRAFRAAEVPSDRRMFLDALGEFRDLELCGRGLALSLEPDVRSHERLSVAAAMTDGRAAQRRSAVTWLLDHFDTLRQTTSEFEIDSLIGFAEGVDDDLFLQTREFLLAPARVTESARKNINEATDRNAQRHALRERGQAAFRRAINACAEQGLRASGP